jgi:Tfp pilus assembly protein PilO
MRLLKRVVAEKRAIVIPLLLILLANAFVFGAILYPLIRRSEGAIDRAARATEARRAAEQDQAAARELVAGTGRAAEELATFYDKVLPADRVSAGRMTYSHLPSLARKTNVRYEAGSFGLDQNLKNPRLGRLETHMALQGDWESIRQFIHELETSPEFVIIDSVSLAQAEVGKPTTLNLEISTYYRNKANGS